MTGLRPTLLVIATLTSGLMTGVYVLYAHTVMPALAGLDDRTFVAAFQALDRQIVNPWFLATAFLGAPLATAGAAVAHRGTPVLPWALAALVLCLTAVVITVAVHVPLNDAVKDAGEVATANAAHAVRSGLDERRWAAWNVVRALTSCAALVCLGIALLRSPG